MAKKLDYEGSIGIVHYSDVSVSDTNCLCFPTDYDDEEYVVESEVKEENSFSNLTCGSLFYGRSGVIQIDKDFSKMKMSSFNFGGCSKLRKLFVRGKKCWWDDYKGDYTFENHSGNPTDDENYFKKPTGDYLSGGFNEMIVFTQNFRYIKAFRKIDFRFPKLTRLQSNFYKCEELKEVTLDISNLVRCEGEFEGCFNLKDVKLCGITSYYKEGVKVILGKDDYGDVYGKTENIGIPHLIYGEKMFQGCSSLTSFNYPLPSLLFGQNMFSGCRLDAESVCTILNSLPDIHEITKDSSAIDSETDILKTIFKNIKYGDYNIWSDGNGNWNEKYSQAQSGKMTDYKNYSTDEHQKKAEKKDNCLLTELKKQKTGGTLQYYFAIKNVAYDYGKEDYIYNYYGTAVNENSGRFGLITLGVGRGVEKEDVVKEARNKATEKGWTVSISNG